MIRKDVWSTWIWGHKEWFHIYSDTYMESRKKALEIYNIFEYKWEPKYESSYRIGEDKK